MDVPEHASGLQPGLIAAYRATRYRVDVAPPFTMTVGVPSPDLWRLMSDDDPGAMFITAWNPLGAVLSCEHNERRQQGLLAELRAAGLRVFPGAGMDASGDWNEEASLLVSGVDRAAACAWGRRHAQNAVLWAGADAVPRLLLLR